VQAGAVIHRDLGDDLRSWASFGLLDETHDPTLGVVLAYQCIA
jgi:hypothetical protein